MAIISPSILAADFSNLKGEINWLNSSAAEWIHFDVMDGQFVPNISFGLPIISACRPLSNLYFDVHLMMQNPFNLLMNFIEAGASGITIHLEIEYLTHCLNFLNSQPKIKLGLAINPSTPIDKLIPFINDVDYICLMSVEPGFAGQKFIAESMLKINHLKQLIKSKNSLAKIQVDGGVDLNNAKEIINNGADILVVGNGIFKSADPLATTAIFKQL